MGDLLDGKLGVYFEVLSEVLTLCKLLTLRFEIGIWILSVTLDHFLRSRIRAMRRNLPK
jgi:hypothetical protein